MLGRRLATLVLIAGAGLSAGTIVSLAVVVAVVGAVVARRLRRPLPRGFGPLPQLSAGTVVAVFEGVAAAVLLVLFFRLARVMSLTGGDSFEFWVPKAKIIYFFGRINSSLFTGLAGPRYPLFVPALQAMDFRFMGRAFGPQLAVQYWFLYAGFVFAASYLLRQLIPAWLAWLFVALTGVIPQLDGRLLGSQADWALDMEVALAALTAVVWLRCRERWLLVALFVLLSAQIATKQEGLLLAGCLFAGLGLATISEWRRTWPPLALALGAAYLVNLPWRIWWGERNLPAVLPTISIGDLFHHVHRAWASLHLVLRLALAYDIWLAFIPIAAGAAIAALTLAGEPRRTAITYLVTTVAAVAGFTYVLWDDLTYRLDEQQSSTPIPRAVGSIVLLSTVMAPLLIAPLLERGNERGPAVPGPVEEQITPNA